MKPNIIAVILLVLLPSAFCFSQSLPHRMTENEKALMQDYLKENTEKINAGINTIPPKKTVRTMAEWEPLQGLMITWIDYPTILTEIVKAAKKECRVYIVCSNANTVRTYLQQHGVDTVNVSFVITKFNSVWCRDYGPWSAYTSNNSMVTIDWKYNRPRPQDDTVPYAIGRLFNSPLYTTTTTPWKLINTGGNFMTDGFGTGFASKLVENENPTLSVAQIDTIMKKFMGISRYIKMNTLPYDEIHHIDMHMKLIDEETLLVGQYPTGVADGPKIEANLAYILANYKSIYGTPYKIIRIPMPADNGKYPSNGGRYFTYTNSSFINKTIIVPTYNIPTDTTALRIYKDALPGYKVIGINSLQSIGALGALHCITKEIGEQSPILIKHQPLHNTNNTTQPYTLKANIISASKINNAKLFWRSDEKKPFEFILMSPVPGEENNWTASIPVQKKGKTINYYIEVSANNGKVQRKPLAAPEGYLKFTVIPNISDAIATINIVNPSPNPVGNSLLVKVGIDRIDKVKIYISDMNNNKLITVCDGEYTGELQFNVNTSKLNHGVYTLTYQTGSGFISSRRIIKE